jgi:DNA polymerase-1
LSQAEIRVLAHLSGDAFLRGVYDRGEDLHSQVAEAVFGKDFTSEQRTAAKSLNFGIAYGLTKWGLSRQLSISPEAAEEMIEGWYARMPRAKAYLDACRAAPEREHFLTTSFGRRRRYGLITDDNREAIKNEASNFAIQSEASDLMLLTAMEVEPQLVAYDALLVNIVHDSILIEMPDHQPTVRAVAALILATMRTLPVRELRSTVRFDADAKVGYHWGSMTIWKEDSCGAG